MVVTQEINERMTQTGPDTPAGKMLRYYWHPVCSSEDLEREPVQPIRLLSENLTLFKDTRGRIGLIGERCAHRAISLAYGIPQENGLRCAYHGWIYDTEGHVIDMPFEPACLPLQVKHYLVEEMGGLVWAYLGPQPAPLLRRFDRFVQEEYDRTITLKVLPCNYVQCMDNSMDPLHFEFLHAHYSRYYNARRGLPAPMGIGRHLKIDFDLFEYGIYKRRLLEGEPEDCDDWTIGHPVLMPYMLLVGQESAAGYQIRVPIDDTHTLHIHYHTRVRPEGAAPQTEVLPVRRDSLFEEDGTPKGPADMVVKQDMLAWVAQSPISDRTTEHLVTSDKGVILYHNLLLEQIERVERGEDPMG